MLIHGRGRTADEMIDLAMQLDIAGTRWLAPSADLSADLSTEARSAKVDGGSWYPHRFMESFALNEPFLSEAVERVDLAVSEASEAGRLSPDDLVGQLGADVRLRIYAGRTHEVSADEIAEAREFIGIVRRAPL